ncbi:MAG TPA: erythromycin esterase family protein [Chitinophagales bacterium]|nr:erythromycin esterase family protein [Chitinophagales bacterium]
MRFSNFFFNRSLTCFRLALLAAVLPFLSNAQHEYRAEDSAWLKNHAHVLSIDPQNNDYSDLQSLRQSIGDSKMVMLGEQSHGDGTTFEAKIRLIKFLHEQMGFDVIAFESGFYDCSKAWESFCNNENAQTAAAQGIFGIWSYSQEVQPLFDYLADQNAKGHPLQLAGFDCQFTGGASHKFIDDLESKLTLINSQALQSASWIDFRKWLSSLAEYKFSPTPKPKELKDFDETLSRITGEFSDSKELPESDRQFWIQECRSLKGLRGMAWTYRGKPLVQLVLHVGSIVSMRDAQMAENLLWLNSVRFHDTKIIVWAASMHIQHGTHYRFHITSMGTLVHDQLGSNVYSIGFIAGKGKVAACFEPESSTINEPGKESLEAMINGAGFENAFIDFRNLPEENFLHGEIEAGPFGYTRQKRIWPEYFDGMIYTHTMKRSTCRSFHPNGETDVIMYYDENQNMNKTLRYDEHGKKLKEAIYKNGKLVSRTDFGERSD